MWPLLLLVYTMSKYKIHPGLRGSLSQLIQLSAFKTEFSLPSPGSSGTTFESDHINQESYNCIQKKPSVLVCDIANPFLADLWGYAHGFNYWFNSWIDYVWQISLRQTWWDFKYGFGHKLRIKSKSQHRIKAQSLEATLPAIILICDVFCMSLPE